MDETPYKVFFGWNELLSSRNNMATTSKVIIIIIMYYCVCVPSTPVSGRNSDACFGLKRSIPCSKP